MSRRRARRAVTAPRLCAYHRCRCSVPPVRFPRSARALAWRTSAAASSRRRSWRCAMRGGAWRCAAREGSMLEFALSPATARFVAAGSSHGARLELLGLGALRGPSRRGSAPRSARAAPRAPTRAPRGSRPQARQQLALALDRRRPAIAQRTARRSNRNSTARCQASSRVTAGPPPPAAFGVLAPGGRRERAAQRQHVAARVGVVAVGARSFHLAAIFGRHPRACAPSRGVRRIACAAPPLTRSASAAVRAGRARRP